MGLQSCNIFLILIFSFSFSLTCCGKYIERHEINTNNSSYRHYSTGVALGIINPEKYPYATFVEDARSIFKDLYREYGIANDYLDYEEWLIMNNFGILSDTEESIFDRKIRNNSRSNSEKQQFVDTLRQGDILVTGKSLSGMLGHAAIMKTDSLVLEMRGGKKLESNNRQLSAKAFYDNHAYRGITVYRVPETSVARNAATWANSKYYGAGTRKKIHIKYKVTFKAKEINPSYCSKMVIQAYYFGVGSKQVIKSKKMKNLIAPSAIPSYFSDGYALINIGKFY